MYRAGKKRPRAPNERGGVKGRGEERGSKQQKKHTILQAHSYYGQQLYSIITSLQSNIYKANLSTVVDVSFDRLP